jgi:hypothetical protein
VQQRHDPARRDASRAGGPRGQPECAQMHERRPLAMPDTSLPAGTFCSSRCR